MSYGPVVKFGTDVSNLEQRFKTIFQAWSPLNYSLKWSQNSKSGYDIKFKLDILTVNLCFYSYLVSVIRETVKRLPTCLIWCRDRATERSCWYACLIPLDLPLKYRGNWTVWWMEIQLHHCNKGYCVFIILVGDLFHIIVDIDEYWRYIAKLIAKGLLILTYAIRSMCILVYDLFFLSMIWVTTFD